MPSNWNMLCPHCLIATKQNIRCGNCGQDTISISKYARVPKKNAKKKEWLKLFKIFPNILMKAPRTKALVKLGAQK